MKFCTLVLLRIYFKEFLNISTKSIQILLQQNIIVTELVYYETFGRIEDGITREKQLKKWNRAWKDKLISDFNPEWKDLNIGF